MGPITFCTHGNLLIAHAISPDLRTAGRALYFGILGAHLAPRIVVHFPPSGKVGASAKLMSKAFACPRAPLCAHWRARNCAIILDVVGHHFHCEGSTKFKLGGWGVLPRTGSAVDGV